VLSKRATGIVYRVAFIALIASSIAITAGCKSAETTDTASPPPPAVAAPAGNAGTAPAGQAPGKPDVSEKPPGAIH
jgi:hypothetical protein